MNGDNGRVRSLMSDTWKIIITAIISSLLSIGGYNMVSAPAGLTGNNAIDVAVMNERVKQNKSRMEENYTRLYSELRALNAKVEKINKSIIELQVLVKDGLNDDVRKNRKSY